MPQILPARAGGDAPILMTPTYRYAGNDWSGSNALTFIVYEVSPTMDTDGNILTSGVPRDLVGCSVVGSLRYQTRIGGAPAPATPGFGIFTAAGAIVDADSGLISLSLGAAQTAFPRQDYGLWQGDASDPRRALLIAQPGIVDATGVLVTIGLQPVFVF